VRRHGQEILADLGGKAPFIVFDDDDIEMAVKGAIASKYWNAGQTCVSANRILVQDGVYDAFTKRLAETASAMKVEARITDALKKRAKVRHRRQARAAQGELLRADRIDRRDDRHGHHQGGDLRPVAPLYASTLPSPARGGGLERGLAPYFYSHDIGRIWRVAEALEYGIVGINEGIIWPKSLARSPPSAA